MEEIVSKVFQIDFSFLIYIFIELIILGGIYLWSKRLKQRWKTVINLGIVILLIRIILFQNPVAWYIYSNTLDMEVIGWRQSSVLYDELNQYKSHDDVKYLAVGSSQTGFLYNYSSDALPNFALKSLAGLSPLDLYLYRENILHYEPQKVLLYLSDFDMGRAPSLETLKLSPSQGVSFPWVYGNLESQFASQKLSRPIKEMLVSELFPEYKYSFVFKGYVDQLFNKNSVFPTASARMSQQEYKQYQFKQLEKTIASDNVDTNLYFLNKFISFFEERNITVVIFEGQYHPEGYTDKNLAVKKMVRNKFRGLEKDYSNVKFFPKSELIWFTAADFKDAYHVNTDGGKKFMNQVRHLQIIDNKN